MPIASDPAVTAIRTGLAKGATAIVQATDHTLLGADLSLTAEVPAIIVACSRTAPAPPTGGPGGRS